VGGLQHAAKILDRRSLLYGRAGQFARQGPNYKLVKAGYSTPIKAGIGLAYGRALMIKAGYNGSGIADVVNAAAKLAAQGCNGYFVPPIMIDDQFASDLNETTPN
jgi:hypothetical protein